MKLDDIEIEYFIDYINRRIHLLDLNRFGGKLMNDISPQWMEKLIEHESLLRDILDFDWICYTGAGIIGHYKDYNFRVVSTETNLLHFPYIKTLKDRANKPYGQ